MKRIAILILLTFNIIHAEELKPFSLPSYTTKSEYNYKNGKKTLINFWATWCTACVQEIPELEKLKKNNPQIEFIAINAGDSKKKIKKFFKKYGFSYNLLIDKNKKLSKSLGVTSLPQTFVIDEKGTIIYKKERPPQKL